MAAKQSEWMSKNEWKWEQERRIFIFVISTRRCYNIAMFTKLRTYLRSRDDTTSRQRSMTAERHSRGVYVVLRVKF